MSNFNASRDALHQARSERIAAQNELKRVTEQLKALDQSIDQLERMFNPRDREQVTRRAVLQRQRTVLESRQQEMQTRAQRMGERERGMFGEFARLSDPRQQMSQLSAEFPVLMLPLRLETRFKQLSGGGVVRHQLWVRVYPDEAAVDTFEEMLSVREINSARIYWADVWRAGGIEGDERAAWRGLVAAHGSGRAAYIVQQYQPLNLSSKPQRESASDMTLVIATDEPPPDNELLAVQEYWRLVWLANGAAEATAEAGNGLVGNLGEERADQLIKTYVPRNLGDTPTTGKARDEVNLNVAFVIFPKPEDVDAKQHTWSAAAEVGVLPDRFVLTAYHNNAKVLEALGNPIPSPLIAGPDPSAPPEQQLKQVNGELQVPDEMRWMVDFERAVAVGMGFKIDLTAAQAQAGFDRLLVAGVRLAADANVGKHMVETLFTHHHQGRSGFSLVPQGTPTNNTERDGSGWSRSEDSDITYDLYFKQGALWTPSSDWRDMRDGQYLADALGIDNAVLQQVRYSDGKDAAEARAMNVALWPATGDYLLDTMLDGIVSEADIESTRTFFTQFVSGRGPLPALRIGNQPYGVLPTAAFSKFGRLLEEDVPAPRVAASSPFLPRLYKLLRTMDAEWTNLAKQVSYVGKQGDPHQLLLDIIGLHPSSVEYYQRYAESLQHLFNRLNIGGFGGALLAALIAAGYVESGKQLLKKLGYNGDETPAILNKFFLRKQQLLKGPLIDDRPLSEVDAIRSYTPDSRNYITWLIDAARTSLDTIRKQDGFIDDKAPNALLYLMLRHALLLSYWETSIRLHVDADLIPSDQVRAVRREPNFVHVKAQQQRSESRFHHLYATAPRITDSEQMLVSEYITGQLGRITATRKLDELLAALDVLKDVPTARLERAFAEHIDLLTYRLDAWELGLINYQLHTMRVRRSTQGTAKKGVYVGAFGWLEQVRSENKSLTPVRLDSELHEIFNKDNQPPLQRDSKNGGYIHAPSLNQAVTAAVLRNAYLANASAANPDTFAVNLSSARVRVALTMLEGMRNGQSLSALLGYQFERGLHDRHNLAEVDEFIYKLRKAFPLRADRLKLTATPDDVPIESIEARNVVDGLSFVNHLKKTGVRTYPFGKSLPDASDTQRKAINAEVNRMLDIHDAVADLALAEGVHQAVQGNYDRAAATLDTVSKGTHPIEPDVVRTPRSGLALTQRVGLQLDVSANASVSPLPTIGTMTPRAQAEPAINDYLASVLPAPPTVVCTVHIVDPTTATDTEYVVSWQDLQLQPIDLLYGLRTSDGQAMTDLDDRIVRHVVQQNAPRPDATIQIRYMERPDGAISFWELAPLIDSLYATVVRSRPLKASDVALTHEATETLDADAQLDRSRVANAQLALSTLHGSLNTYASNLQTLADDPQANRATILSSIDALINEGAALMDQIGLFGISQRGSGASFDWRRQIYGDVMSRVRELVARWQAHLVAFDAQIAAYELLTDGTSDQQRFELLRQAEREIVAIPVATLPATPAGFQSSLGTQRGVFASRLNDFRTIINGSSPSLAALLNQIRLLLPVDAFDVVAFSIEDLEQRIVGYVEDLLRLANSVLGDIDTRLAKVKTALAEHDATAVGPERVAALQAGAQALFGDDFKLVPSFGLSTAQGQEWQNAVAASTSGDLLNYLTTTMAIDFPVDDWLYGVARVREKLRHWERVVMLAGAFNMVEPQLTPIQLPFKAGERWVAMPFPDTQSMDGERLLYTAHYTTPFDRTQRQCGLLVDEWTEVIPAREETTGVAFHYDRPNAEPPQVMLLVTPTSERVWEWQDLLDALNETLDMAKKRAVEPVHVDDTPYARFLPATVMATTLYQISIGANLALNNHFQAVIAEADNG